MMKIEEKSSLTGGFNDDLMTILGSVLLFWASQ